MSDKKVDRAIVTAFVIAGHRHELLTPIELHDGDLFRFHMEAGVPHMDITRSTDCVVEVSIGTAGVRLSPKPAST